MGFKESLKTCFEKYADFSGRASPPEYWWFFLFVFIVTVSGWIATIRLPYLGVIISLALLLPFLSVMSRRLHDTNRTGWWMLVPGAGMAWYAVTPYVHSGDLAFFAIAGVIVGFYELLKSLTEPGDPQANRYGPAQRQRDMDRWLRGYIEPGRSYDSPTGAGGYRSVSPLSPDAGSQRYCEQCGAERLPGARFCIRCGAGFRPDAFPPDTDAE